MQMQQLTAFKIGKLNDNDCKPLIERMTYKRNSWTSKHLSFAGRLKLLNSLIVSIQNDWCFLYCLALS